MNWRAYTTRWWPWLATAIGLLLLTWQCVACAPHPLLMVLPGPRGCLFPLFLVLAAVASLHPARPKGAVLILTASPLLLLLAPSTFGTRFDIPLAYAASWAFTGSADGIAVAILAYLIAVLSLIATIAGGQRRLRLPLAWTLCGAALFYPWLGFAYQCIWNGGAKAGLLALAGVASAAALALLVQGTRVQASHLIDNLKSNAQAGQWASAVVTVLPMLALLGVYFVLKLETIAHSTTDEGIYFYAASAFARGEMPYRDFFFSHPPLHVLVPGLVVFLLGPSFVVLKLLSVFFSMGSGVFLYLSVEPRGARLSGTIAAGVFLLALEQLQASTNLTGINITVFFLCAALYLALSKRYLLSGVLAASSILSGLYAIAPALAILTVPFYRSWKAAGKSSASLAATLGLVNGFFYWLYKTPYVDQVVRYHFAKPGKVEGLMAPELADLGLVSCAGIGLLLALRLAGHMVHVGASFKELKRLPAAAAALGCAVCLVVAVAGSACLGDEYRAAGLGVFWHNAWLFVENKEFLRFAFFHPHLVLAPLALLGCAGIASLLHVAGLSSYRVRPGAWAGLGLFAASFTLLSSLVETYTFYYVLLIPGAALMLGGSWPLVLSPFTGLDKASLTMFRRTAALLAATLMLGLCTLWVPYGHWVGEKRFPEELAAAGQLACYSLPPNAPSPLSGWVRSTWVPPCRWRGGSEPGVWHYLWKKTRYFANAEAIARFVAENTRPEETILGTSLVAPLVALLSDRRLAAGYVDTNSKRFKSGMTKDPNAYLEICKEQAYGTVARCKALAAEREMWDEVCRTPLRVIIAGPRSFFTPRRMKTHPVLRKHFRPVTWYNEPYTNSSGRYAIVLYWRVRDEPYPDGSYCGY